MSYDSAGVEVGK